MNATLRRPVFILVGLILIAAAALKAHAIWTSAEPGGVLFTSQRSQVAIVTVELLLGAALILGLWPAASWLAAVATFSVMALANVWNIAAEQTSCGCLGVVRVSPWTALVIDVALLSLLALAIPSKDFQQFFRDASSRRFLWRLVAICGSVATILALAALSLVVFVDSSLPVAIVKTRGDSLYVAPGVSNLGSAPAGESRDFFVELRNLTDRPVRVVGGTSDCRCTATNDLPLDLPPQTSSRIRITLGFTGSQGAFERRIWLYTDEVDSPFVILSAYGRVLSPKSSKERRNGGDS